MVDKPLLDPANFYGRYRPRACVTQRARWKEQPNPNVRAKGKLPHAPSHAAAAINSVESHCLRAGRTKYIFKQSARGKILLLGIRALRFLRFCVFFFKSICALGQHNGNLIRAGPKILIRSEGNVICGKDKYMCFRQFAPSVPRTPSCTDHAARQARCGAGG